MKLLKTFVSDWENNPNFITGIFFSLSLPVLSADCIYWMYSKIMKKSSHNKKCIMGIILTCLHYGLEMHSLHLLWKNPEENWT